ncbi:hypothetical protein KBA63_01830 [Candidatus Woesebacteria bacterium]|nr:hypothetical protein [Candidatus Woesebacteria bacterium]MBP9687458.1 hypothetical protein [Candidatus Woesebacteria bacterium]
MSNIRSYNKGKLSGLMKRLGADFLPENAVLTSCDVRSAVLKNLLLLLAGLAVIVSVPLLIISVTASTVQDIKEQSSDWWATPAFLLLIVFLAILPKIFQKSKAKEWLDSFLEDNVELGVINIPGPIIVGTIVVISLNVFLYVVSRVPIFSPFWTWPLFSQLVVSSMVLFCVAIDVGLAGSLVLFGIFQILKVVYKATIGKETKIEYMTTDQKVHVAYYPWYKAKAIQWSLCKIYEPS